jgi:hypothetical protein
MKLATRKMRAPVIILCKCKFNLGGEEKCRTVEGRIDNEQGISESLLQKGDRMLGDIFWHYNIF